jgi:hypothetical protein
MNKLEQKWGRLIKSSQYDDKFEIEVVKATLGRQEDFPDRASSGRWVDAKQIVPTELFSSLKEAKKGVLAEFNITSSNHGGFENLNYGEWDVDFGEISTSWYAGERNEIWSDEDEAAWERGEKQKFYYRLVISLMFKRFWSPEIRDIKNSSQFE